MKDMIRNIFLVLLACPLITYAQNEVLKDRCATTHRNLQSNLDGNTRRAILNQYLIQKSRLPSSVLRQSMTDTVIKIPVVVHVIHHNADNGIGGANISDEQIKSQIEVLNEDYRKKPGSRGFNTNPAGADVKIEFMLATLGPDCLPTNGITRHYSSRESFDPVGEDALVKSFGYWPNDSYLNIWLCSITNGYLGYSQFPNMTGLPGLSDISGPSTTDGIIINHKNFGNRIGTSSSGIYSYGRTVTHEVGHWLGLLHTWGDDFCGTDYCDDTPAIDGSNLSKDCTEKFSNCNGASIRNMIENYLDYSPDLCMNVFTQDQKARMRSVFTTAPDRIKILSSKGKEDVKSFPLPFVHGFESEKNIEIYWSQNIPALWQWASKGAYNKSNHSVFIDNPVLDNDEVAVLSSSFIDLNYLKSPVLIFDLAYPTVSSTDILSITAYTGCSAPKITLATFEGGQLITSTNTDPYFTPLSSDWKTKYIKLNIPELPRYIKLQIESKSKGKARLFLDNINLSGPSDHLILNSKGNPSRMDLLNKENLNSERILLEAKFEGPNDLTFEIFDVTGRKVYEKTFLQAIPGDFELDFITGSNAFYLVKASTSSEFVMTKILLSMQ